MPGGKPEPGEGGSLAGTKYDTRKETCSVCSKPLGSTTGKCHEHGGKDTGAAKHANRTVFQQLNGLFR